MFLTKSVSVTNIISILIVFLSINSCALIKKQAEPVINRRPPFSVNQRTSPRAQAGQIEAQFNNLFPMPGIKTVKINVLYFPAEDAVCLEYKLNTFTYQLFWHRAGREAFVKALEKYNADFDAQKLSNRNARTRNRYGVVEECYLVWEQSSRTSQGYGNADIELGYYFRENSPFFAATQMEAFFDSPTFDDDFDQVSAEIPIFFTRAQAEGLTALFAQDYLQSIAPDARPPEERRSLFSR